MDQNEKVTDVKRSLNARLILLAAGIMLVVNGASSSVRSGLSWMNLETMVKEAQTNPGVTEESEITASPDENGAEKEESGQETGQEIGQESGQETGQETGQEIGQESGQETGQEFDLQGFMTEMENAGITTTDLHIFGIFFLITAGVEILAGMICAILSNRVDRSKITFTAAVVLVVWELIFLAFLFLRGALMLSVLLNSVLLPAALLWGSLQMRKMAKADPERVLAVKPARSAARKNTAAAPRKNIRERASWEAKEDVEE